MTTAVFDLVTEAIHQRLRGSVEAVEVVLPEQYPTFSPRSHQVVIVPGDPTPVPELSAPGNPPSVAYNTPYIIECTVIQDDGDGRSIDSLLAEFSSAVIATMTEPTDWHQWGGNAINTTLGTLTKYIPPNAGYAAHRLQIDVVYRVAENNPYQQR